MTRISSVFSSCAATLFLCTAACSSIPSNIKLVTSAPTAQPFGCDDIIKAGGECYTEGTKLPDGVGLACIRTSKTSQRVCGYFKDNAFALKQGS